MFNLRMPEIRRNKRLIAEIALAAVALLAFAAALWNWYHPRVRELVRDHYETVPVEKKVEKIKRVTVPGPERIVTIDKTVIVEKLALPAAVASDPVKQVIANADLPPSEGGISTVTVLDTRTGESTIIAKEKPLPFLAFLNSGEVGVRYGVTTAAGQQGWLHGRWEFLRVGAIRLYTGGEISTRPEAAATLGAVYRW